MRFLRATTPLRDGDAKRTRRSRHARRPKDALRHVRTPFRAEAARLEVDVARSARNAARFADRDRRYRLFGFSILAAVYFSCRARHASRAPDRARRAPLTSSRALRPSPCSGDTVERRGRARGGRRHPRGAQDRAVPDREWCSALFGFSTLAARTLFSPPRDTRRFATAATDARGVSDARHGRGARLDTRTRRPALKTRASRSASLNPGCNAARSRIANGARHFSVFRHWPRVLSFHHPAIPAASRPPRLTRAAFPMRVTVEGHASTLELAVPL